MRHEVKEGDDDDKGKGDKGGWLKMGTKEVTTGSRAKIGKELRSKRRGDVEKGRKK